MLEVSGFVKGSIPFRYVEESSSKRISVAECESLVEK